MQCRPIHAAIAVAALAVVVGCAHAPSPREGVPAQLRAIGTEPFWAVTVEGTALTWTTPDNSAGTRLQARRSETAEGARFEAEAGAMRHVLVIGPGPCSDGMSDRVHAYSATWTVGARVMRGCANPGLAP